jgi:hypothetical protein
MYYIMTQEHHDQLWFLVLLTRRYWTSLSFTITFGCGWALVAWAGLEPSSFLWWTLASATLMGCTIWLLTRRRITIVQRRLRAAATAGQISALSGFSSA